MANDVGVKKTAAQAYLEVAVDHGVDYVFGLPGTSGQEFIGTIADQEKVRFVLALHETCVVSMADGHARVPGRPSLAPASTPPGSAPAVGVRGVRGRWPRPGPRPAFTGTGKHPARFGQCRRRSLRRLPRPLSGGG